MANFEIIEAVTSRRGDGAVAARSRLVAVGGQYLFPRTEAEALAGALAAKARNLPGRPTYRTRQVYLPACGDHSEHDPGCGPCSVAVSAWLEELRQAAEPLTVPA